MNGTSKESRIFFNSVILIIYQLSIFKPYRMSVFESNMKIINEHNKGYKDGRYSWYMGINQFTDWTPEEFSRLNNLQIPDAPKTELVYEMKADEIAEAIDWRKKVILNAYTFYTVA